MASKKSLSFKRAARNLEEYWDINFVVVGSRKWFENSFDTGVVERLNVVYADENPQALDKIVDYLSSQKVLGVDTETAGVDKRAGLDPWREGSNLLLFQIGTADQAWIIEPAYLDKFRSILEDPNITLVLHNGVFDYKFILVKNNITLINIHDTMVSEQVLTAGRSGMRVGLADTCRRYKPYRLISKDQRKEFVNFKERGNKFSWEMIYYSARDIVLLFPIAKEQAALLQQYNLMQTSKDEFNLIPCTAMMETGGVYINQKTLGYAIAYWKSRQVELEDQIIKIYEEENPAKAQLNALFPGVGAKLNVGSASQKKAILRDLGYEVDNVQRDTLKEIDHEVARLLAEYSEVIKVVSTYGENLLQRINPVTGRLHPEFNQLGLGEIESKGGNRNASIATGRYSSNFQQMPKPKTRYAAVSKEMEAKLLEQFPQYKCQ